MVRELVVMCILGLTVSNVQAASNVAYNKVSYGRIVAHVVTVNLSDPNPRVTVALAKGGTGRSESFKSMVRRTHPTAAITGTFFDTKTLVPTGDIALCGAVVHSGCIGSALCIDANNKASVVPLKEGRKTKWQGYETVLCAGPTLVADGKVAISLKRDGFRSSLLASTRRTAVGITSAGKLLIVAINRKASLYDISKLMIKLKVVDGLCLDGGSSTGFYAAGRFYATPSRMLTNCLMVYSTDAAYQSAKPQLAPTDLIAEAEQKRRYENWRSEYVQTKQEMASLLNSVQPLPANSTPQICAQRP